MTEDQTSICTWAEDIFGPVSNPEDLVRRASIEMQELLQAVKDKDIPEVGRETADIVILLYRLMREVDLSLGQEVDQKMAINRKRKWRPAGDGTGSHVKD